MIQAYQTTTQTVTTNNKMSFATIKYSTGCTATIANPTSGTSINLIKPGYYSVTVNAVGSATTTSGGSIGVQLYQNGFPAVGAQASAASSDSSDIENLSFTTLVKVYPSCPMVDNTQALTVVNTGVSAAFSYCNIVVTKIA